MLASKYRSIRCYSASAINNSHPKSRLEISRA
jgi:hypothetical protein